MSPPDDDPLADLPDIALLTVSEIADTLRVSRGAVYGLIRDGQLECLRFGSGYRVPVTSLREFLRRTE